MFNRFYKLFWVKILCSVPKRNCQWPKPTWKNCVLYQVQRIEFLLSPMIYQIFKSAKKIIVCSWLVLLSEYEKECKVFPSITFLPTAQKYKRIPLCLLALYYIPSFVGIHPFLQYNVKWSPILLPTFYFHQSNVIIINKLKKPS